MEYKFGKVAVDDEMVDRDEILNTPPEEIVRSKDGLELLNILKALGRVKDKLIFMPTILRKQAVSDEDYLLNTNFTEIIEQTDLVSDYLKRLLDLC